MKSTSILYTVLVSTSLFLTGCTLLDNTTEQPLASLTSSPSVNSPTLVPMTLSPTDSPTRTPTLTPSPTLSQQDAAETFVSLIEKDGECSLPCWLSVIPGQTKFEDVENIFLQFGAVAYTDFSSRWATIRVFLPDFETATRDVDTAVAFGDDGKVSRILVTAAAYQDKNGPINYTDSEFQRMWRRFFVPEIFTTHGMPEKIFLDTTRITADPTTSYPFVLWIIYPQQGFLMRYSGNNTKIGNNIRICPAQSKIEIRIWDVKRSNYEEFIKDDRALGISTSLGPQPLESVTDYELESFYEAFKGGEINTCFETPASIWPH